MIALAGSGCEFSINALDPSSDDPTSDGEARVDLALHAKVGDGGSAGEAGGAGDLSVAAPADLANHPPPDLASPPPDLVPPGKRLAFLLPPAKGNLGGVFALDARCTTAANVHFHFGVFVAVIAYPGLNAKDHIKLGAGRDIILVDGTKVATDATFWSAKHLAPINLLVDGSQAAMGDGQCVWTNFKNDGMRATGDDCVGWSKSSGDDVGNVSDPWAANSDWGRAVSQPGCDSDCYVYCLQQ